MTSDPPAHGYYVTHTRIGPDPPPRLFLYSTPCLPRWSPSPATTTSGPLPSSYYVARSCRYFSGALDSGKLGPLALTPDLVVCSGLLDFLFSLLKVVVQRDVVEEPVIRALVLRFAGGKLGLPVSHSVSLSLSHFLYLPLSALLCSMCVGRRPL
jgi:hypothetical protein